MAKQPAAVSIEALRTEVDKISHPAARPFSLLLGSEWEAYLADIRDNGQLHPIIADKEGRILDGRNRWLACRLLGREPVIEIRDITGAAAVELVISANIARRHDDQSVRAVQLAKLLAMAHQDGAENFPVPTQAAAAAAGGISDHTLRDGQRLLQEAPDIAEDVDKRIISLHAGRQLAKLPEGPDREEALRKVRRAGNKTSAKRILKEIKKKSHPVRAKLEVTGLTGRYAILMEVLKNVRHMSDELRNLGALMKEHQLAPSHATQLRAALKQVLKIDFDDLRAAVGSAIAELDQLIKDHPEPDVA